MANRFLDTNYYKSPFVRGLEGALKSLYSFIICDCDGAGIWNMDLQAASLYIGFSITPKQFDENFVKTGKAIDLGGAKFFFPDFIEHQYPGGLQANNKAHKNFILTLKKYDLLDENLCVKTKGLGRGLEASLKASYVQYSKGNGNGNSQGNELAEQFFYPNAETVVELSEMDIGRAVQYITFTKHVEANNETVQALWGVFKTKNFTGKKPYKDKSDIIRHFFESLKFQQINGKPKNSRVVGKDPVTDKL